jgi:hypothetical protein
MRTAAKVKWRDEVMKLVWEDRKLSGDQWAVDFATTFDWEAYGPFGGRGPDCDDPKDNPYTFAPSGADDRPAITDTMRTLSIRSMQ